MQGVLPTTAMRTAWLLASRGPGGEQRVVRSEDDGISPVEGSSAEGDDSASSSMESNDTYGSVAALFSYEARKKGMATALKGDMHQRVCLVLVTMSHGTLDYVDADVDITYRIVLYHGG